jgi:hypothetical protein
MSSTTNFYRNSAQPVSVTQGNKAQSVNNLEGEHTMDTTETEYTDEEQRILDGIKDVNGTPTNDTSPTTTPGEIPAGSYLASITSATTSRHELGKYDIVRMEIEIQAAPHAGHIVNKVYHIKTKKVRDFFKREAKEIGHEVIDRNGLNGFCNDVIGTIVFAEVAPSDSGNQSVYLKNANTKKNVAPIDSDALWID